MEPLKKKIITAFVIMLAFGVISSLFLYFIDLDGNKKEKSLQTDFDFHFADFDKNIFEDKEYLELNRDIAYKEGATTILITDGEYEKYGPIVAFFAEYIDSIIRGDHERYNTFFAEEYLDAHGKKDVFTMQQLYNIKLEYLMAREMELDGETYLMYDVELEYMIRKNNGTFRNDMGSDAIRTQHIQLIDRDGKLEILTLFSFTIISIIS